MMKISIIKAITSLVLICISAQLSIDVPFNGDIIPITLQSLAVICCAVFLIVKESAFAIGLYLLLGALGVPVFADSSSGFDILTGNSGGYLIGFLIAAVLVSMTKSDKPPYTINELFSLMLLGTAAIVLPGVLYLAFLNDMGFAVQYGLVPIIPGAIIKIIAGTLITFYFSKFINSKDQ